MENKITLESLIKLAVNELDEREYENYISLKDGGLLPEPDEKLDSEIEKIIRKQNRKDNYKYFAKVMSKVAVCFMILVTCASFTFLTADAVRESVVMVAMEWYEKFTRTTISAQNPPTELPEIELGYIPEGFAESKVDISNDEYYHKFERTNGSYIEIVITISNSDIEFNTDNERLGYYSIIINGNKSIWINKKDFNYLLLYKNGIAFNLNGNVTINELISIYENINII